MTKLKTSHFHTLEFRSRVFRSIRKMNASNPNIYLRVKTFIKTRKRLSFSIISYFLNDTLNTFLLIFHGETRQFIIICLHSARGDSACKYFLANETRCRVYEKLSRANVVIAVFN